MVDVRLTHITVNGPTCAGHVLQGMQFEVDGRGIHRPKKAVIKAVVAAAAPPEPAP